MTLPYVPHSATSKEAAILAAPNAGTQRRRVLDLLLAHPLGLTDDEMQVALGMGPQTQCPRRIELVARGLVGECGATRKTRKNRNATVWVALARSP